MRDEPDGKMDIYDIDVARNVTSRLISNAWRRHVPGVVA